VPAWLEILLLAIVGLIVLLALGGAVVARRRETAGQAEFERQVQAADHALAAARAEDRGWDRDALEAAARAAFAVRRPGAEIGRLTLVQVVDRPGIEEDRAVFRIESAAGETLIALGREGGEWVPEELD
jgi:hypothetical protein